MVMYDLGVSPREEREGTPSANHVNRLPKAVQNEHRLVERRFHTGAGQ